MIESKDDLYKQKKLEFAIPRLYTVFTGCRKVVQTETESEQRLSDLYREPVKSPDLELIVHTYDFNMAYDEIITYLDMGEVPLRLSQYKNRTLFQYALFANCATYIKKCADNRNLSKPVSVKAVLDVRHLFRNRSIFVDLFESKEVCEMAILHYSLEK